MAAAAQDPVVEDQVVEEDPVVEDQVVEEDPVVVEGAAEQRAGDSSGVVGDGGVGGVGVVPVGTVLAGVVTLGEGSSGGSGFVGYSRSVRVGEPARAGGFEASFWGGGVVSSWRDLFAVAQLRGEVVAVLLWGCLIRWW